MAARTKAKASKVTEVKPTESEVKETVTEQEIQTVEENVTDETLKEETYVEAETTSEPEGVCVDEIVEPHMEEPDTCDQMPKYNEDEVCDDDFKTIQTDTPGDEEKPVSENKQGNLGYGYVYMWNGMASD